MTKSTIASNIFVSLLFLTMFIYEMFKKDQDIEEILKKYEFVIKNNTFNVTNII